MDAEQPGEFPGRDEVRGGDLLPGEGLAPEKKKAPAATATTELARAFQLMVSASIQAPEFESACTRFHELASPFLETVLRRDIPELDQLDETVQRIIETCIREGRGRTIENVEGFLCAVARNRVIDLSRKEKTKRRAMEQYRLHLDLDQRLRTDNGELLRAIQADRLADAGPLALIDSRLKGWLMKLSIPDRELVYWRYLFQPDQVLAWEDVGARVGITAVAARKRWERIIAQHAVGEPA